MSRTPDAAPPPVEPESKPDHNTPYTRWRPTLARFVLTSNVGIEWVHEGPGLTLERVLAWQVNEGEVPDEMMQADHDEAVWQGEAVVAIIRHRVGQPDRVIRLDD